MARDDDVCCREVNGYSVVYALIILVKRFTMLTERLALYHDRFLNAKEKLLIGVS